MKESSTVTKTLIEEAITEGNFELADDLLDITELFANDTNEEEEVELRCLAADVYEYFARTEDLLQILSPYTHKIPPSLSTANTAQLLLRLGSLNYLQQEYEESITRLELAKGFFEMMDNPEGGATALHFLGRTFSKMDRYQEAVDYLNRAIEAYDHLGLPHRRGVALLHLALTLEKQGDIAGATSKFYEAEQVLSTTKDTLKRASCTNNIGLTLIHRGNYKEAAEKFSTAIDIFMRSAHIPYLAASYNNLAWAWILMDEYEKAEELLDTALKLHRTNNDTVYEASTLDLFGLLRIKQSRYQEAERLLTQSLILAEGAGSNYNIAIVHVTRGKLRLACKQLEQATIEFREAASMAERIGDRFVLCEALLLGAESYLLRGECERSRERLEAAKRYVFDIGNIRFQAHYQKLNKQLTALMGNHTTRDFKLSAINLPTREEAINQLDEWLTRRALEQTNYNTVRAAKLLGVSRIWLYELKKRYDIMSQKVRVKN